MIKASRSSWLLAMALTVGCGTQEAVPPGTPSPESLQTTGQGLAAAQWSSSARLLTPRGAHVAALLDSGLVLVAGGFSIGVRGATTYLASAELYNPYSDTWQSAGSMGAHHTFAEMVKLASGKVVITGGRTYAGTSSAVEVYDPRTNTWTPRSPMLAPREGHQAVRLASGKVLVVGGGTAVVTDPGNTTAELYDPDTDTWSFAGDLGHTAWSSVPVPLYSGEVLLVNANTAQVELYDPSSNTWRHAAPVPTAWLAANNAKDFSATRLYSGSVLVVGGNAAVLYDPYNDTWSTAAAPPFAFNDHAAALLYSGQVLLAGGHDTRTAIYDPQGDNWTPTGNIQEAGNYSAALLLHSGQVLMTGSGGYQKDNAFIFSP